MLICDDMTQVTHAGDFTVVKLVGSEFFSHQLTDYRLYWTYDHNTSQCVREGFKVRGGNVELDQSLRDL